MLPPDQVIHEADGLLPPRGQDAAQERLRLVRPWPGPVLRWTGRAWRADGPGPARLRLPGAPPPDPAPDPAPDPPPAALQAPPHAGWSDPPR